MLTNVTIIKRNGNREPFDVTKIHDMVNEACDGLSEDFGAELEVSLKLNLTEETKSSDVQKSIIAAAVEKIDYDRPYTEYIAARLFIFDLYHNIGRTLGYTKGTAYGSFRRYMEYGTEEGRLHPFLTSVYGKDFEFLQSYIVPERDMLFKYLGIKTMYDRYLLKDTKGECFELPQYMFLAIAMFLCIKEKEDTRLARVLELYDTISKLEVMLATPTLSNARTNRHQLSSCYIGTSPDNIEGIFDAYKEMGILSKFGGGIGWDWNLVRALGGVIDNNVAAAGGVIPFTSVNNAIVNAVDQLGK